jgi:mannose-1-phosphate guanylyltransferase
VLQHIFDLVARAGVEAIHVNVHYLADAILGLYGTETQVNGAKIRFTREKLPRWWSTCRSTGAIPATW